MSGPICPRCGHTAHRAVAVDRFRPGGPGGYVAVGFDVPLTDLPLRATRAEAEADACAAQMALRETGDH